MRLHQLLSSLRGRRAPTSAPVESVELVLYTRRACPLCDEMKDAIAAARLARPHRLRELDVDADPELFRRFGSAVPVLEIAGRVAFEGRLETAALERELERRARELEAGSGSAQG